MNGISDKPMYIPQSFRLKGKGFRVKMAYIWFDIPILKVIGGINGISLNMATIFEAKNVSKSWAVWNLSLSFNLNLILFNVY